MTEDLIKRKLSAILSADAKDYSRLMRSDEEATVRTLTKYRSVIAELVSKYQGRVVDSPGDNVLAEFASVVHAVQCGFDIQASLQDENAKLSEDRKMEFRIGINLGDVIQDGKRIYGDGVNVAARMESLAEPGGLCVSGSAYDQIENKFAFGCEYLGEKTVKNISSAIRVYRLTRDEAGQGCTIRTPVRKSSNRLILAVLLGLLILTVGSFFSWTIYQHQVTESIEPASVNQMAYPLPEKPSIAVLSFSNISDDPEIDYFINGFSDTLITALSKMPGIFVIARSSTSIYKGKSITINKIAEELGIQYVIDGSIQKSGERLRITVKMIDALTGYHVWSDQYSRNLKDIFVIQDDIVLRIIKSVGSKYNEIIESVTVEAAGTNNLDAYLKNLMSLYLYESNFSRDNYNEIIHLAEEAIVLDQNFLNPYIRIVYTKARAARYGFTESPDMLRGQALDIAQIAVNLQSKSARAHGALGRAYYELKYYDKSITAYKKVLELDPNEPTGYDIGWALCYSGRESEAFPFFMKYRRLNPKSIIPLLGLSLVNLIMGNYENAIPFLMDGIEVNPNFLRLYLDLAACYAALGLEEEAKNAAKKVLALNPAFSIDNYINKGLPVSDLNTIKNYVNALKKVTFPKF